MLWLIVDGTDEDIKDVLQVICFVTAVVPSPSPTRCELCLPRHCDMGFLQSVYVLKTSRYRKQSFQGHWVNRFFGYQYYFFIHSTEFDLSTYNSTTRPSLVVITHAFIVCIFSLGIIYGWVLSSFSNVRNKQKTTILPLLHSMDEGRTMQNSVLMIWC